MYPEETALMEVGCFSHSAILQPQNELCYMATNVSCDFQVKAVD